MVCLLRRREGSCPRRLPLTALKPLSLSAPGQESPTGIKKWACLVHIAGPSGMAATQGQERALGQGQNKKPL